MKSVTVKTTAYWITTAILALDFGVGGVFHVIRSPQVVAAFAHLGYPEYFVALLGIAKVLGAVALLVPRFPRLKEWAYAGIVFDIIAAAYSLAATGAGLGGAVLPIVFGVFAFASWALRPE